MENLDELEDDDSDRPSEAERLQVTCLRLKNKVKTLKEVSSIRKNLLELRERESLDLIRRLEGFEAAINNEKEIQLQLSTRLKEADAENRNLSNKLSENIIASNQAKIIYEERVRSLAIQLDEAAESLDKTPQDKECQRKILENVFAESEAYKDEMDSRLRQVEKQREEGNRKLLDQKSIEKELKSALQKALEENSSLRLELAEYGTAGDSTVVDVSNDSSASTADSPVPAEAIPVEEVVSDLSQTLPVLQASLMDFETSGNRNIEPIEGILLDETEKEIVTGSIIVGVNEFIERLDEAEKAEFVQIPGHDENCYISVLDANGGESKVVLSVSRTFMKLKDLIIEKKALQHEIHSLKQLSNKLESQVDRQSRRLYLVNLEVNKTWRLVSQLRAQCGQLHTSKSIHRYELQEKRRFVEKLKGELGASRQKWMKLREKNMASQIEWESIRDEFARRRFEIGQSRESAFFEDSSSTTTSSIDGDHLDTDDTTGSMSCGDEASEIRIQNESDPNFAGLELDMTSDLENLEPGDAEGSSEGMMAGANFSYEELINRRARRLLELEEECRTLFSKLKVSKVRNTELASKLANLHRHYGSENLENPSEDSALDGEDSGLLSEASGDTAHMSRNSDVVLLNSEDDTEIPSEIEDDYEYRDFNVLRSENVIDSSTENAAVAASSFAVPLSVPDPCSSKTVELKTENNDYEDEPSATTSLLSDEIPRSAPSEERCEDVMTPMAIRAQSNYLANPDHLPLVVAVEELEKDEGSCRNLSVHSLSRIIIQQLPKCLAVLKNENFSLRKEILGAEEVIKEAELKLDKERSKTEASVHKEMELRTELDLKQRLIRELTTKIQIATENYETINQEHGQLSEYIQIKLLDTKIQEQRKLVKMRNLKHCTTCSKKFSLFKRKAHCNICGYSFCADCLFQQDLGSPIERDSKKKALICNSCDERKRKLDSVVQEHFKNVRM